MPRLPIVGSDDGTWGGILNEFLEVEHNADGTLNTSGTLGDYAPLASPTFTGTVTVPAPSNATDAVTKSYVDGLDGDNVKVTGDQSVAGVKTFTSAVRGNYSTDGKFFIGGTTGVGGFAGFYGDNSDSDANPRISINALTGIQMGTGSATPDTILTRSAAKQLSINSSEGTLAGNLSPTIDAPVPA